MLLPVLRDSLKEHMAKRPKCRADSSLCKGFSAIECAVLGSNWQDRTISVGLLTFVDVVWPVRCQEQSIVCHAGSLPRAVDQEIMTRVVQCDPIGITYFRRFESKKYSSTQLTRRSGLVTSAPPIGREVDSAPGPPVRVEISGSVPAATIGLPRYTGRLNCLWPLRGLASPLKHFLCNFNGNLAHVGVGRS